MDKRSVNMNKKYNILLVEDEESVRAAIKFTLEHWYSVTAADKNQTALKLLNEEKFDLIILDMFIVGEGEEGSLKTLSIINKKYPTMPVIILTGSVVWTQKWQTLRKLGAYGYLSKPFDRNKAKELIDRCIKGEKMNEIWN